MEEKADFAAIGDEDITFAFDTVFIVRKTTDRPLDGLRGYLSSIGDSLVIGEDDESFKVHVHTDTPGSALNEAQKYGTLELAKIENMRTQAADLAAGRKAQSTDDLDAIEEELENGVCSVAAPEKRYGFLAVCAGDGLAAVFRDLGVDRIVSGGQTMNPSTEAILREIDQTPSRGGVRPAQQQEHRHGSPAVRGPVGEGGHRRPYGHGAPGHLRHDVRGSGGAGRPECPAGHDRCRV